MKTKTIALIVVLALVAGAIWFLERNAPAPAVPSSTVSGPALIPGGEWFNSVPLTLDELHGKVVLVDFWTYSCINCIRTLPYLTMWDAKYRDEGLVIIGVHSPEFDFEKDPANVKRAIEKFGIKYPVMQDNDHQTWNAFQNQYWPHEYLFDIDGKLRHDKVGEGEYDVTEREIQELLQERADKLGMQMNVTQSIVTPSTAPAVDLGKVRSPEMYLGYAFRRNGLGNAEGYPPDKTVDYVVPSTIQANVPYNVGTWKNNNDNMELVGDTGAVLLQYYAKNVHVVASADSGATIAVYVDGKKLDAQEGTDVVNGTVAVKTQQLYTLVNEDYAPHNLELHVAGKGFKLYTFTFG
jgi:thiol-disulfide isomerase/thioredoxin